QRRVSGVTGSKCAQYDLVAAAGVAKGSDPSRAVEFCCMCLQPARCEIHVTNRSRISGFGRLPKLHRAHHNTSTRELSVDTSIIHPVAVMPRAAVHVDDGRKRPGSSGLINPHQPRLSCETLILDIPFIDFIFCSVHHGGNLLPSWLILQDRDCWEVQLKNWKQTLRWQLAYSNRHRPVISAYYEEDSDGQVRLDFEKLPLTSVSLLRYTALMLIHF